MSFTSFLDPVLGPVLYWNPLLAIFILSLGITGLITIVYKFTTDQKRMKKLTVEIDRLETLLANPKIWPAKRKQLNAEIISCWVERE